MDKRVPEVRFKGFTDDWEQQQLKNITSRVKNNDGRMNLPTLTISASKGWLDQKERFSKNQAGKEQKNYTLLSSGELSYNHGNSKLAKYGTVFVLRDYTEALVPRIYHSFKMKNNNSACFIEYLFATKKLDRELRKLVTSGARLDGLLNISYDTFMSMFIKIPEFEEQFKIAKFLKKIDDTIALYQHQLELYKKIKQSLLQTMFPKDGEKVPKVRFTDFHDDWEQHSLKEVMKNFIVPMRDKPKKFDGNIPWTRIEDIDGKYLNGSKSGRYVSNNTIKEMHLKIIPSNSIIVSASATFGVVAIVTQDLVTNQTFIGMVPNSNYTIDFLYSLFQSPVAQKKMKKESAGSTIFYIPRESFEKMKFNLPIISEQNKVGTILKKIDSLISKYEYQLILYKDIKKFNLQKLYI